ncbi:MAG: hypothetical protein VKJ06_07040 [Vampirovibrionales bacterium]|nr:hypothetical protein [Vampirovibrionales bacterium]
MSSIHFGVRLTPDQIQVLKHLHVQTPNDVRLKPDERKGAPTLPFTTSLRKTVSPESLSILAFLKEKGFIRQLTPNVVLGERGLHALSFMQPLFRSNPKHNR